jgi:hypothetical protein
MIYDVGRYVIAKPDFWCFENASIITIIKVDHKISKIFYYYDDYKEVIRERDFCDFYDIVLVPSTPLMEELI